MMPRENKNENLFTDDLPGFFRSVGFLLFLYTISLIRTQGMNPLEKQHADELICYLRRKADFAFSQKFILTIASYPIIIFIDFIFFNGPADTILVCSIIISTLVIVFFICWGKYFLNKMIRNFCIYVQIVTKFESLYYLPFSFLLEPLLRPPQR